MCRDSSLIIAPEASSLHPSIFHTLYLLYPDFLSRMDLGVLVLLAEAYKLEPEVNCQKSRRVQTWVEVAAEMAPKLLTLQQRYFQQFVDDFRFDSASRVTALAYIGLAPCLG